MKLYYVLLPFGMFLLIFGIIIMIPTLSPVPFWSVSYHGTNYGPFGLILSILGIFTIIAFRALKGHEKRS